MGKWKETGTLFFGRVEKKTGQGKIEGVEWKIGGSLEDK